MIVHEYAEEVATNLADVSQEERGAFFAWLASVYCLACGAERTDDGGPCGCEIERCQ